MEDSRGQRGKNSLFQPTAIPVQRDADSRSIMGTLMTTSAVFGVIAPVLVGWIFDIRGNYREPFALMAFTLLIAIPMILTLGQARVGR